MGSRKELYERKKEEEVAKEYKAMVERHPPEYRDRADIRSILESYRKSMIEEYDNRNHTVGTGVLELSSFTLHSNRYPDGQSYLVCGTIELIQQDVTAPAPETLFNRKFTDPLSMSNGSPLMLFNESGGIVPRPLPLCKGYILEVNLWEASGETIVQGHHLLDFSLKFDYDKPLIQRIDCNEGYVIICYTVFQSALIASLYTEIVKTTEETCDDNDDTVDQIYGSISASIKFVDGCLSRSIFDKSQNNPVRVFDSKNFSRLSKSVIVVPAYSSLCVHVRLCDRDGDLINGDVDFDVLNLNATEDYSGHAWFVRVYVDWRHPFYYVPEVVEADVRGKERFWSKIKNSLIGKCDEDLHMIGQDSVSEVESNPEEGVVDDLDSEEDVVDDSNKESKDEEDVVDDSNEASTDDKVETTNFLGLSRGARMEVFSVFVCCYADGDFRDVDVLKVKGSIEVYDKAHETYCIFNRDKDPDIINLSGKTILQLEEDMGYEGPTVGMRVDLKDDDDLIICKGHLNWDTFNLPNWYDKRLCSVIPGPYGFAAVHYSIFRDAVLARVEVTFLSSEEGCHTVYGNINARSNILDFDTYYDREYYQSVLFTKPDFDPVTLENKGKMKLSKSVVAVPSDLPLVFHSNLMIQVDGEARTEELVVSETFLYKTQPVEYKTTASGSRFQLSFKVSWSCDQDSSYYSK